jgi:hypothetical protein
MKRCIYCKGEISHDSPVDVCARCGFAVWGEKMFNAIISGMSSEKAKGNMDLGRVGMDEIEKMRQDESKPEVFVEKEIISAHHEFAKSVDELDMAPKTLAPFEEVIEISDAPSEILPN